MASSSSFLLSTSSSSFFIFFLYLSMNAWNSNARDIRVTNIYGCPSPEEYCKIGEKLKISKHILHQGANAINGHQHDSPSSRIPVEFDARFGSKAKEEEDARRKSGVIPFKFVMGSVSSSSSAHEINKDKHPGVYADYSRPRTRPPSHN